MGDLEQIADSTRKPTQRGGGLLWLLVLVGILAATLVSTGVVRLDRASGDPEEIYREGRKAYVEGDPDTALRAWMHAASLGHLAAKNDLADMYLDGYVIQRSEAKAFDLYREAANRGYAPAQANLGVMYETGRGTVRDDERAAELYRTAADRGYAGAQTRLGWLYERGRGVAQSDADALHWYQQAAAQGNPGGQVRLGLLFKQGRAVAESPADALFWFGEAAKQGDAGGQTELGVMYREGRGVPRDWARARRWLEQAADQDDARAQYLLGEMYYAGNGVPRDPAVSADWFRKAAEQGNQRAKQALDRLGLELAARDVEREAGLSSPESQGLEQRQERERPEVAGGADENRPGHCRIGDAVELRSRLDCLNRGGVFKSTDGDDGGSFVTLEDHRSWREQRRDLRLRMGEADEELEWVDASDPEEAEDDAIDARSRGGPGYSSDWIVCYDRGTTSDRGSLSSYRATSGRLRCFGPKPKPAGENGSSYCRGRGYSARRLFKHETSALRWEDENCD